MEDPFTRFATECGLSISAEAIYCAPYDIAEPPWEAEQAYLVTVITDSPTSARALQLVFMVASDLDDDGGDMDDAGMGVPQVRDVLWWLAADAWSIEHASRDLAIWTDQHGFDADSDTVRRRFEILLQQAVRLADMIGEADYSRLVELHRQEAAGGQSGSTSHAG